VSKAGPPILTGGVTPRATSETGVGGGVNGIPFPICMFLTTGSSYIVPPPGNCIAKSRMSGASSLIPKSRSPGPKIGNGCAGGITGIGCTGVSITGSLGGAGGGIKGIPGPIGILLNIGSSTTTSGTCLGRGPGILAGTGLGLGMAGLTIGFIPILGLATLINFPIIAIMITSYQYLQTYS
jgi:hypothetical protein